ncbi:two-component sensor histidine kinase [Arthrobacter sp. MYb211]|uniref:sensor histidine kinase n=1 Tax=unclassified Arthrobacter TaxID=235627 RepID=UPI000CFB41C7|nr:MULTISPECIES: HAMP domain-containing sensor histidine kinase [unclassified Arthrobacter]PRA13920.1 two-component sensor histidine kinase [Arthrobacter sp. MYb221]PRC09290.1 two-component sensor histidine kinase [Arthrobacter sp. MYb211]
MRLRVIAILGSLLALLVVIVSAVLMQSASVDAAQELRLSREASLNRFIQLGAQAEAEAEHGKLQLEMDTYSKLYDEALLVRLGTETLTSGQLDPTRPEVARALENTELNLAHTDIPAINPFATGNALIARPFGNSTQVLGSALLEVNLDISRRLVLQRWIWVVLLSIAAGAGLLLLADRVTAWVLKPIHRLNEATKELAKTKTSTPLEAAGPPELRELAHSFSKMSDAMTASLAQQRELIAETSHQLRNPVAALRLRVDLLKLRLPAAADPQAVQAVEKELHRVESLLDAVLRLASADHRLSEQAADRTPAARTAEVETVKVRELLIEEIERQSSAARQSGTQLLLESGNEPEVLLACNEFELQQMLAELYENCLKYAAGTPIETTLRATPELVEISIRDHGPGLSEAQLAQVSERFWRADPAGATPGTGLGMAIVERLARANAGELRIAAAEGGGLCFSLLMPRGQAPSGGGQAG